MSKKNGTKPERKPTAVEVLVRGGLTPDQIARARLKNLAEQTAWNVHIIRSVIVAGVENIKAMWPDIPPEEIEKWGLETIKATRVELDKTKKK